MHVDFPAGATNVSCTSNFVFEGRDDGSLYLGTAAHCLNTLPDQPVVVTAAPDCVLGSLPVGAPVYIQGASRPGTIAYSSWLTMLNANETDKNACRYNDFALVQVAAEDQGRVHPAVLGHGGPIGVANSTRVQEGDKVLSFGQSAFHAGVDALKRREGYVVSGSEWTTAAYMATPAVFGDSGGPLLDGAGNALGVLITLNNVPPAANGITNLDRALAYAKERAGIDVLLATWPLLDEGVLPSLP